MRQTSKLFNYMAIVLRTSSVKKQIETIFRKALLLHWLQVRRNVKFASSTCNNIFDLNIVGDFDQG